MAQYTTEDLKPTLDPMFKYYKSLPEEELDYLMNPSLYEIETVGNSILFWTCFLGLGFFVFGAPLIGTISLIGILLILNKYGFNYLKKVERYTSAMKARILTEEHYNDFVLSKMPVEKYHKKWNIVINDNTKLWTLEELSPIANCLQKISKYLIIISSIFLYILL